MVSGHAHQRFRAAAGDARQHRGKCLESHGAVLGIHQQPVVAAVRQLLGNGGAVRIHEQAELGPALAQLLLKLGSAEHFTTHFWCNLPIPDKASASEHLAWRITWLSSGSHESIHRSPVRG